MHACIVLGKLTVDALPFRALVRALLPENTTLPAATEAGSENGSCSEPAGYVIMTYNAKEGLPETLVVCPVTVAAVCTCSSSHSAPASR
jgi:hypothetical protein